MTDFLMTSKGMRWLCLSCHPHALPGCLNRYIWVGLLALFVLLENNVSILNRDILAAWNWTSWVTASVPWGFILSQLWMQQFRTFPTVYCLVIMCMSFYGAFDLLSSFLSLFSCWMPLGPVPPTFACHAQYPSSVIYPFVDLWCRSCLHHGQTASL